MGREGGRTVAESLRKIHNDNAMEALIESTNQTDARVRLEVLKDIGKYFHPRAKEALIASLKNEKNPRIIAQAVKGLGPYHDPAVKELIDKYLSVDSYHNIIADGAVEAIHQQDDPSYIAKLLEKIKDNPDAFSNYTFQSALEALAYIDRNEKNRDQVRDFLCSYLPGRRDTYKAPAIRALGTLEDPKAIAILETFSTATKDTSLQKESEWAINNLRWNNKPHDNLKDLRAEVIDLQKSNRELKKELEDLKSKVKALNPVKPPSTAVKAERLKTKSK